MWPRLRAAGARAPRTSCACRFRRTARAGSFLLRKRLRVLGLVGVLGARVDLQLRDLPVGEPVAGEHPLDRLAQHLGRPALELLAEGARAEASGVARVAVVALLLELLPGDGDLLGVHDDDEVACVDVRRVLRLALAAQRVRDARGETAEVLALGVHEVPALLDLLRLGGIGLHRTEKAADQASAERGL